VAGVSINTVYKLLADAGKGCAVLDDVKVRGAKARRMEVDGDLELRLCQAAERCDGAAAGKQTRLLL
jgi:hypothetical protein